MSDTSTHSNSKSEDSTLRKTPSGIPLPSYPETGAEIPGAYPYTRGIHETMYQGRLWTMRQYSGFGSTKETNQRFRYLLEQGQMGLSVAFDLPTQIGYDSDAPEALGEVGKVGVPISTLEDMDELFDGIDLSEVSVSMTINSSASILLAFFVALAKKRGIDPKVLRGTLQNDILKEFIARHTQRFPLEPSMRLVIDVLEYSNLSLPKFNSISISGYHIRESGSTAIEEVAFTISNAIAYLESAKARNLPIDALARRISFFFNSQMNFIEEIAKFRAARRIWAKIIKERFQIDDERSSKLRFHTQTAGAALTYQEKENNIVRVAIQALAAVLGGTQSLHTNSFDEALALPTEHSAKIALRTQQIIAHETGVADVADPLGGSPLIEELTDTIEAKVNETLKEIEKLGGPLKAVEEGTIQRWIENSSYHFQQQIEKGERVVVSVNKFKSDETFDDEGVFVVDPELENERIQKIQNRKKQRSDEQLQSIEASLKSLREAAQGSDNLLPYLIEAAEAGASIGEMMGTMAQVFGEYQGDL